MELEYHIKLPKQTVMFSNNQLTFSVHRMKSRLPSVCYFIFHLYNRADVEIKTNQKPVYVSERWAIDKTYSTYYNTFEIDEEYVDRAVKYQIEMVFINVNSENPVYFNGLMLNEGEYEEYHEPMETATDKEIAFLNSSYANLYSNNECYLQVIRPTRTKMHTNKLDASQYTVICPHFDEESDVDHPINIFMEFINQTEQRIDVLR